MKHVKDFRLDWCQCCGRPEEEIIDYEIIECDGVPNVVHPSYLEARRRFIRITEPLITEVMDGLRQYRKAREAIEELKGVIVIDFDAIRGHRGGLWNQLKGELSEAKGPDDVA